MATKYLGELGEKLASALGQGKKKRPGKQFEDVKSGSSSTAAKKLMVETDEEIFEKQSRMRNLIDRARKATNKQVR